MQDNININQLGGGEGTLSFNDFRFIERLGLITKIPNIPDCYKIRAKPYYSGTSGVVYRAEYIGPIEQYQGKQYAIKVPWVFKSQYNTLATTAIEEGLSKEEFLVKQIAYHKQVNLNEITMCNDIPESPYLIRLVAWFIDRFHTDQIEDWVNNQNTVSSGYMHLFMVFELMHDNLANAEIVSVKRILMIIYQILHGMFALQQEGFVHRNIKEDNILISEDQLIVKICDFETATRFSPDDPFKSNILNWGSGSIMPTELCHHQEIYRYDKADIYSIGCLFIYLLKQLGDSLDELAVNANTSNEELTQICMIMKHPDPDQRLSIEQAMDIIGGLVANALFI